MTEKSIYHRKHATPHADGAREGKEVPFAAGKRMPYLVPEGFMKEIEAGVLREIASATKPAHAADAGRHRWWQKARWRVTAGVAAAACAAAVAVVSVQHTAQPAAPAVGQAQVEQAFARLSPEDRAFYIEVYQNDIFFNE